MDPAYCTLSYYGPGVLYYCTRKYINHSYFLQWANWPAAEHATSLSPEPQFLIMRGYLVLRVGQLTHTFLTVDTFSSRTPLEPRAVRQSAETCISPELSAIQYFQCQFLNNVFLLYFQQYFLCQFLNLDHRRQIWSSLHIELVHLGVVLARDRAEKRKYRVSLNFF